MNKSIILKSGVIVAVILVLVIVFSKNKNTEKIITIPNYPNYGALSTPDLPTDISQGGMRTRAVHVPIYSLGLSTTTLCSIQSPVATSTLIHGSVTITTGTSTALQLEIAKSTSPNATTTVLNSTIFGTGVTMGTLIASSTLTNGADPSLVFSPNQYLVVKYGGTSGATQYLQGSCNAQWVQVSGY